MPSSQQTACTDVLTSRLETLLLRPLLFAQFVGLGYHCFLTKRIQDVKKGLAQKSTEKKTKEELNLEEKLLAWLGQHSLIQILDWFRCVDYVATTGNDSASKWTTETTKRDQLFLKLLGVS